MSFAFLTDADPMLERSRERVTIGRTFFVIFWMNCAEPTYIRR